MAHIEAVLKIHETGSGTLDHVYTSVTTSNASSVPYSNDIISWVKRLSVKNQDFNGAKLNQLGAFKLGSSTNGFLGIKDNQGRILNNYNGIVFGYTNNSKQFDLILTFVGTDIGNLKIVFDRLSENYPTTYTVSEDGGTAVTHTNSSSELQVSGISGTSQRIVITFSAWSKANTMVAITFIENQVIDITLDKKWINSFTTQNQLTSQPQQALYGLVPNTGSLELKDYNNTLLNYAQIGYLKMSSFGVEIYVNHKIVEKHVVSDNPYYSSDKTMDIRLSNFGNSQRKISMENYSIQKYSTTLYQVVYEMLSRMGFPSAEIDNMFSEYIVYNYSNSYDNITIEDYFYNMVFRENYVIKEDTMINLLNRICQATRTYIYVNNEGKMKFVAATVKRVIDDSTVIDIPYKKQASSFSYDIITNNNYDDVNIGSLSNSTNAKNVLEYGNDELLEVIEYEPKYSTMDNFISDEILEDYENGIRTGQIDIFPSDFYNSNSNLLKDWSNGDLIEVNDIVRVLDENGDSVFGYWQVVDRTVRYKGQVIETLVLREIKRIELEEE